MPTTVPRSPGFVLVVTILVLIVLGLLGLVLVHAGMDGNPAWPWDVKELDPSRDVIDGVRDLGGLTGPAVAALAVLLSLALAWNFERLPVIRDRMARAADTSERALRREWHRSLRGPAILLTLGIASLGVAVATGVFVFLRALVELPRLGVNVTHVDLAHELEALVRTLPLAALLAAVGILGGWAALARVHRAALAPPPEPPPPPPGVEEAEE